MAAREITLLLLCLFCGTFADGGNDVDLTSLRDVLSLLAGNEDIEISSSERWNLLRVLLSKHSDDLDDAGISLDSDDDDESDDALQLELADNELDGGCHGGVCDYCTKFKAIKFCLVAAIVKPAGFDLKVTVNGKEIMHEKISEVSPKPICVKAPLVGKACIEIYDVNLAERSACVRVEFKIKVGPIHKKIKLKIACFHIGKGEEGPMTFIQLLQAGMADRRANTLK